MLAHLPRANESTELIAPQEASAFARRLLAWWKAHGRKDLPWQNPRTPYRVWISEVMLQQTQVRTAAPYFERFVARWPSVAALAAADLNEVLHAWSGLGYYARARNLHRAAGIVVRQHGGALPQAPAQLAALPGIGRSTAAAIAAQAHNVRAAFLDGNAKRLLCRHFRVPGPPSAPATQKALWSLAEALTPAKRVAEYTQAVMDMGATVCRPRQPRCPACPLRGSCQALAADEVARFPERAPPATRPLRRRRFFVVTDERGACYLEQRPAPGVWGGLWSPPEQPLGCSVAAFLKTRGWDAKLVRRTRVDAPFRHAFTHFALEVEPVFVCLRRRPPAAPRGVWADPAAHRLGVSAVAAKLLAVAATPRAP